MKMLTTSAIAVLLSAGIAMADGHAAPMVEAMDQDVSNGVVSADMIVAAILQEPVASGDMLMLMVHAETGGMATGVFEYTLGATEDGPIKPDGNLVMAVITAQ